MLVSTRTDSYPLDPTLIRVSLPMFCISPSMVYLCSTCRVAVEPLLSVCISLPNRAGVNLWAWQGLQA